MTVAVVDRGVGKRTGARSTRALRLPACVIAVLTATAWLPSIRQNPALFGSVLSAAAVLLAGLGVLVLRVRAAGRTLGISIDIRKQHYLQACAQGSVLLYWGYYWRPVYDAIPLIGVQLLFAYAFDMLLAWSRRDDYTLGFAPFPVIFSTNLFLWFKPEWFYLQFLMVAVGFAAKELIRWNRDGRRVHIFNPSSFPLAVFSLWLIATGNTSMTFGPEIATTQFHPPQIYLFLFLIGLPGQLLFGVTTMTMSAVVTTYLVGFAYFKLTGAYFFIDSYIPIAVFLGMHLLFTDPSTSPRTELGRILFGVVYGVGNMVLYAVLTRAGVPAFYDKLLPVPIMNLSVRIIDAAVRSTWLKRFDPARLGASLPPRARNLVYVSIWLVVFSAMSAGKVVGDEHPGHTVPFWQHACQAGARNGCDKLALILDDQCGDGSGWACNEVAVLRWHKRTPGVERVPALLKQACSRGYRLGCINVALVGQGPPRQGQPDIGDYAVLLRTGKGPLPDTAPLTLATRACDQGWVGGCDNRGRMLLQGDGVSRDPAAALVAFDRACDLGLPVSCSDAGLMHYKGDGIPVDKTKALAHLQRACDLGYQDACRWRQEYK